MLALPTLLALSAMAVGAAPAAGGKRPLLVAVISAPTHTEQRNAIRRTWGAAAARTSANVDLRFFIGRSQGASGVAVDLNVAGEAEVFKDIIFLHDLFESYDNLTVKTLHLVQWAATAKVPYAAMVKCDDDSYFFIDRFVHATVNRLPPEQLRRIWWGRFWGDVYGGKSSARPVVRQVRSKYFMPPEEYASETYPDYPDGPAYAIGADIISYLNRSASSLPRMRLEDAAMGVWITRAGKVWLGVSAPAYLYNRKCSPSTDYFFVNPVLPVEMDMIHNATRQGRHVCTGNFSLQVCNDVEKQCLCDPSDRPCWADVQGDVPPPTTAGQPPAAPTVAGRREAPSYLPRTVEAVAH